MEHIMRDEVNQHTSDEVAKVLAEMETLGVDVTAIKEALASGGSSVVKSVQRGTVKSGSSAEINAVNVDKAVVLYGGQSSSNTSFNRIAGVKLTSSTTVEAFSSVDGAATVAFAVLEFY